MKTLLLIVSWIQGGPQVQVLPLESATACVVAAESASRMIAAQALSNMASPHGKLKITKDERTGDWRLSTGVIGREVARIACVHED